MQTHRTLSSWAGAFGVEGAIAGTLGKQMYPRGSYLFGWGVIRR